MKYIKNIILISIALILFYNNSFCQEIQETNTKFFERKPAEIKYIDRPQLIEIVEKGLDIASLDSSKITVWVNEEEFTWVKSNGWEIQWIELEKAITPSDEYHTYAEMTTLLEDYATNYPLLCRLESTGQSVQGRELWVMKITDNPDIEEAEPEVKLISTMHGNEPVGMEMLLNLIALLLEDYDTDTQIQDVVNGTEIWIMPLMNPDGNNVNSRYNAHGVDLNRSFPDRVDDPFNTTDGREPEVQAIMNFTNAHSFVLSANFHTGSLVVNYPYDSATNVSSPNPDWYCPDNDVFIHISKAYSMYNSPMYNSTSFDEGITHGITWYAAYGGMQDWNYVWQGCSEVTIELSNSFAPSASTLPLLWTQNKDSLLNYIDQVNMGVRGIVTDVGTGEPLSATITVVGRDHDTYTDPEVGDYYRMLLPGTYDLQVEADGHETTVLDNVIINEGVPTILDVNLNPNPNAVDQDIWEQF